MKKGDCKGLMVLSLLSVCVSSIALGCVVAVVWGWRLGVAWGWGVGVALAYVLYVVFFAKCQIKDEWQRCNKRGVKSLFVICVLLLPILWCCLYRDGAKGKGQKTSRFGRWILAIVDFLFQCLFWLSVLVMVSLKEIFWFFPLTIVFLVAAVLAETILVGSFWRLVRQASNATERNDEQL